MRILGLDPGLNRTGWAVLDSNGNHQRCSGCGVLTTSDKQPLPVRLATLYSQLQQLLERWQPHEAAVEETFVNTNPRSALKLGQARGVVVLAPAAYGIPVHEYAANSIKKTVTGAGHADKKQVQAMLNLLLPGTGTLQADAADALATALCHAHHTSLLRRIPA